MTSHSLSPALYTVNGSPSPTLDCLETFGWIIRNLQTESQKHEVRALIWPRISCHICVFRFRFSFGCCLRFHGKWKRFTSNSQTPQKICGYRKWKTHLYILQTGVLQFKAIELLEPIPATVGWRRGLSYPVVWMNRCTCRWAPEAASPGGGAASGLLAPPGTRSRTGPAWRWVRGGGRGTTPSLWWRSSRCPRTKLEGQNWGWTAVKKLKLFRF